MVKESEPEQDQCSMLIIKVLEMMLRLIIALMIYHATVNTVRTVKWELNLLPEWKTLPGLPVLATLALQQF